VTSGPIPIIVIVLIATAPRSPTPRISITRASSALGHLLPASRGSARVRRNGPTMLSTRIRLVALDLDGTLVGEDLIVRPRVREAIAAAQAQGVAVTIVTGRMFRRNETLRALAVDRRSDRLLSGRGDLRRPERRGVARNARQCRGHAGHARMGARRGVHAQCYADDTLYVEQINRFSRRYTTLSRSSPSSSLHCAVPSPSAPRSRSSWSTIPTARNSTSPRCKRCSGKRAYITRSHVDFVEVLDPAVNKGEALSFVAARHGVTLEQTLAVGDAWNDVPLLDAAAVGVAMGSGPPELLSRADHVVADVAHDGVAEAIERYVLA